MPLLSNDIETKTISGIVLPKKCPCPNPNLLPKFSLILMEILLGQMTEKKVENRVKKTINIQKIEKIYNKKEIKEAG